MAVSFILLAGLRVLRVDHFGILHVSTLCTLRTLSTLVELLRDDMRRTLQLVDRLLDDREIVALRHPARSGDGRITPGQLSNRQLLAILVDRLLHLIRERIGLITRVDQFAP